MKLNIIRSLILVTLSLGISFCALGQKVNYNRIILPVNAEDISVEERLVQLAWENNPQSAVMKNQVEIAHRQLKLERFSLLDAIRLSGNINEFVINPSSEEQRLRADFYPLYNFSASISIGDLFSNPQKVQLAHLNKKNEMELLNTYKLQLREEVLLKYERYLLANDVLSLQRELLENNYNTYLLEEENFKNGKISLNEYNRALVQYKNKQIDHRNVEANLQEAKVALERLIGVELETVTGL